MDLIGIPIRITIGKKAVDNIVEWKQRKDVESSDLMIEEVVLKVQSDIQQSSNL